MARFQKLSIISRLCLPMQVIFMVIQDELNLLISLSQLSFIIISIEGREI